MAQKFQMGKNFNISTEIFEIKKLYTCDLLINEYLWTEKEQFESFTLLVTEGSSSDSGSRSDRRVFMSRSLKRTLVALIHS